MGATTKGRRQKLSDVIVEEVKRWIVAEGKQPGDRLPNEKELVELFGYSKSTVREALKALEVRGLITVRTGPSGGAYLQEVSLAHASEPLRNFLHFQKLQSHHIYQLRKTLEPELAYRVVGHLTEAHFTKLEENIDHCCARPTNEDELRRQRELEIEFHAILAEACPNPVLAFMCQFLNDLLRDLVVYKLSLSSHQFGETNADFHRELIDAFRAGDAAVAQSIMAEHMNDAAESIEKLGAAIGVQKLLLTGDQR